jgi:hypothetical protein
MQTNGCSFDGCERLRVRVSENAISYKKSKKIAKFMLIYRDSVPAPTPPSPEEMQGFLALWGEWFQQCGASIVDGGDLLAFRRQPLIEQNAWVKMPLGQKANHIGNQTLVGTSCSRKRMMRSRRLIETTPLELNTARGLTSPSGVA